MIAQEAKFELVKYSLQGRITEYLVKLYDADGHVELYHITDYYNKDIGKFAVKRLSMGIRWWEDVLGNGNGKLYPSEILEKYPKTW